MKEGASPRKLMTRSGWRPVASGLAVLMAAALLVAATAVALSAAAAELGPRSNVKAKLELATRTGSQLPLAAGGGALPETSGARSAPRLVVVGTPACTGRCIGTLGGWDLAF